MPFNLRDRDMVRDLLQYMLSLRLLWLQNYRDVKFWFFLNVQNPMVIMCATRSVCSGGGSSSSK